MSHASSVEALFFAALEKRTAAERAAFLDSACGGNAELRRQVEKMLNAHPRVGDFLQKPVADQLAGASVQLDATQEIGASTAGPSAGPAGGKGPSLLQTEGEGAGAEIDSDLDFLQPSTRPDSLGRLGHYEVLQVLGQGGFGIVFRAFDEVLLRMVAIKVLAPQLAVTSPARKRFLREARSSARVRHENVVQVYAVEEEPLPYLVMEFVPGETLQQRLDRTGPLEVPEVVRIGRQIAEGLQAAHGMGLIHRDIKPANILIEAGPHQHVKITDFGLARAADDASLSQSGLVAGTPMYMAPEQASGDTLDHRADLFSLGSVLYTMCSGRPPFRAKSTLAVLRRVAEDTPRPIPEIIPETPQWLCDIIGKLHAKKPEDRIGTAKEVADLLARGLAERQRLVNVPPPVVAKRPPLQETSGPAPALRPRFRTGRWAAAVAGFLLLVGLGFTEATGVTDCRGTVIRLFSLEGTLVVEVDDPGVSIKIAGSDLVITGAGAKEIRLKPGSYTVEARKDGKIVSRELVTVTKNGKQVVRVSQVILKKPPEETPDPQAGNQGSPAAWTVLKPIEMKSEGGATLKLQGDGSILASGEHPAKDSYTLTFRNLPAKMQALRLEVLPHSSLPNNGPGRHPSGEFVLTTVKAQLERPKNPGAPRLLKLANAWADNSRGDDSDVRLAIDEDDNTGWVPEVGKPHFAVFELAEAVTATEGMVLRVTLEFKWEGEQRQLGCFRLSVAPDANAVKVDAAAAWERSVAAMPAEEQVKAVGARLQERNPGFDGKVEHKIEGEVVTELNVNGKDVRDLSPVRALVGLKVLSCTGGPLSDLSALKGMKLTSLSLAGCPVQDLSPLQGMKLTSLNLHTCTQIQDLTPLQGMPLTYLNLHDGPQVRDLSPLQGMKLTELALGGTKVRDLSPLQGMPLTSLALSHCAEVRNLSPLQGMPLTVLYLDDTQVRNLESLKNMPLKQLYVYGSGVTDLKTLQTMQLEDIRLDPRTITQGLDILRNMKSLKTIGLDHYHPLPAAEFWARYDKGEFKKEADGQAKHPDRRAAEYVLSIGGTVRVNGQDQEIKAAADLPREAFQLTWVLLDDNKEVSDSGLAHLKDCNNLKYLNLDHTQVGNSGLVYLKGCKNLTELNVGHTRMSDAGLAYFKDCENLTHLNLDGLPVGDAGLAHLKDCKNLRVLWAQGTRVGDMGLAHLKGCKNLTELLLNGSPVTDAGLIHLKDCKELTHLELKNTRDTMTVTDAGLAHLKECKKLTVLLLQDNKVTAGGIDELQKALPKCKIDPSRLP